MAPKRSVKMPKRWLDLPLPERNQRLLALIDRELEIAKIVSSSDPLEHPNENIVSNECDKDELVRVCNAVKKTAPKKGRRQDLKISNPKKKKDPVQKTIDSLQGHLRQLLKLKPPKYPKYDLLDPSEFEPVPRKCYSEIIPKAKKDKKKTDMKRLTKSQDRKDTLKPNKFKKPIKSSSVVFNKSGHQHSTTTNPSKSLQHPPPAARKNPVNLPPLHPPSKNREKVEAQSKNIEHHTMRRARQLLQKGPPPRPFPTSASEVSQKETKVTNGSQLTRPRKPTSASSCFRRPQNKVRLSPIKKASICSIVKREEQKFRPEQRKSACTDPCVTPDKKTDATLVQKLSARDLPVYSASNINIYESTHEESLRRGPDLISRNRNNFGSVSYTVPDLLPSNIGSRNCPSNHSSYQDIISNASASNKSISSKQNPFIRLVVSNHNICGAASKSSELLSSYSRKQHKLNSSQTFENKLVSSNNSLCLMPISSESEPTTYSANRSNLTSPKYDPYWLTQSKSPRYCQRMDRVTRRVYRSKIPVLPTIRSSGGNKKETDVINNSFNQWSISKKKSNNGIHLLPSNICSSKVEREQLRNDVNQKKGVGGSLILPPLVVTEFQQQNSSPTASP